MAPSEAQRARIEANRRRYEELKAAGQLLKTGQADHPILVSEHAGWNMDCEAIAPPTLFLV
jgi:hypothetical protein